MDSIRRTGLKRKHEKCGESKNSKRNQRERRKTFDQINRGKVDVGKKTRG